MDYEQIKAVAKAKIQSNRDSQEILRRQFRAGEISREDFLKRVAVYRERTNGIQSVFASLMRM